MLSLKQNKTKNQKRLLGKYKIAGQISKCVNTLNEKQLERAVIDCPIDELYPLKKCFQTDF